MNILLINHYAGSPEHGMEYRHYYLAREWVRSGHRVTIVSGSFSHLRTRQPAVSGDWVADTIDGIRYVWLRTPVYAGNGLGRLVSMGAFVAQMFRHSSAILSEQPPDVVVVSSTYPFAVLPALHIKRRTRASLVTEVRDLWPLTLVEVGGFSKLHPLIVTMRWAEKLGYRVSDHVVSTLPNLDGYMANHGVSAARMTHVPHGVDVAGYAAEDAIPTEHQQVLRHLHDQGSFVVGYAGAHGVSNALGTLLDAVKRITDPRIAFVLVGQGPEKAALQAQAARDGLRNVVFLPAIPRGSVPELLRHFDACFVGWQDLPIYRFGISPNKLMDYMMAGRPIVHATSSPDDTVAAAACGVTVPAEAPDALAEAFVRLANTPAADRTAMGLNGRAYVVRHRDYRVLADAFLSAVA
jgi:glycosyltransferase involved in cell wall biosynthesis